MFKIVAAGSVAAVTTLWCVVPAAAQTEAQDRCREVLAEQSFDPTAGENSTFYVLSRFSAEAGGQQNSPNPPEARFAFPGITAALSTTDVGQMLRPLLPAAEWQTISQNRFPVLLLSGQEQILKAWRDCIADQGGGLTVYFQAVSGKPTTVELHIDYRRPEAGSDLPAWRVERNRPINPKWGRVVERPECLQKNYTYAPGQECIVKIETVSAWSAGNVTLTLSDGKATKDVSAYLAPRATLRGEQKGWPTNKMISDWARAHPNDNPINVLSRYADEKTGARAWDLTAQREVETGWYFVEGRRTMSADNAYALQSDDVHVDVKPSGSANSRDCVGGYRIDPAGKILFMGIGLGPAVSGPSWCHVTVTATMAKLVFDPPPPAGASTAPAAPRPSAAVATDRSSSCEQRFRSYDPQTGTYLGTDGARHPCP
jgi:hypothetical protein